MRAPLTVCALITMTACSAPDMEALPGGFEIVVAGLTAEGCEPSTNGDGSFPPGVDSVVLQIDGPEGYSFAPRRFQPDDIGDGGAILVEGVPPGEALELTLYGCAEGSSAPTWSGQVGGVDVDASEKTARRIYFTPKSIPSCTGRAGSVPAGFSPELAQPRALPALARTHEGNALIIGGFTVYVSENANTRVLSAGDPAVSTVTEYRPSRGLFAEWGSAFNSRLLVPRAMHHVVPLDAGRRHLVIGGITRATISALGPPLLPTAQGGNPVVPSPAVEVLDAEARTVVGGGLQLGPLPYSALAHAPDGTTIVLSGGRLDSGAPSNKLQFVTGTADALAGGTATVVTKDSAQPQARMGHTATWFGDGQVLLLGGNVDDDLGTLAEVLSGPQFDAQPVIFDAPPASLTPMALHRTEHVRSSDDGCEHAFLTAGGVSLTGGANPVWISPGQGTSPDRLLLLELDTCQTPISATVTDYASILGSTTLARRAFHQLTPLGSDLFMLSGGYHQLAPKAGDPACAGDTASGCYLADISILEVGDDLTVSLSSSLRYLQVADGDEVGDPRFGHTVGLLPNGTALTVGGLRAVTDAATNLVDDPELLNPARPSEATVCAP